MFGQIKINNYHVAFVMKEEKPIKYLRSGRYFLNPFEAKQLLIFSERDPWLKSDELDKIIASKLADEDLSVIDLQDHQRALVWIDGRFDSILTPGLYALWNKVRKIEVQIIDASQVIFKHDKQASIINSMKSKHAIDVFSVQEGHEGLFFIDGKFFDRLPPGQYCFWKNMGQVKLFHKDLRELSLEINGQEIMTQDKVSLRINGIFNYRIKDALKSVLYCDDLSASLYREAQMSLRAIIGSEKLEDFLHNKDNVITGMTAYMKKTSEKIGVEILNFGIKDIILPGDMKVLMNKVIEAQKAAEANVITRREETAAMRSQLNTARLLENNPVLMRLKELEILEKISENSKLNVILGNEKLSEKVMNLL